MENNKDQLSGKNITPGVSSSPESETAGGNEAQLKTAAATNLPENSSLGLLLSDITSLILLSLSTEKFLQKVGKKNPSEAMNQSGSKREIFQLLEAAGSTIDVLYDLLEKETAVTDPPDLEGTLVKGASNEIIESGNGIGKSTSTKELNDSPISCHSNEYLSCESELSRSLDMYRSCEQLIQTDDCAQEYRSDHPVKSFFQANSSHGFKLDVSDSSRSLSHLDQRSLLTVDSGIASPYQSACQNYDVSHAKDDSFLPKTSSVRKEHEVVGRVRKLKITVDQKLRDSLANLSALYTEDAGTASLREHVRKMQIRYEKATTDQWKSGSMYDVIMDKALATSVLAMENAQLGNEVNALRQELQMTYEQAKEKEGKGLFVSRFQETISQPTEKDGLSDSEDSSSDISTPDTQLLSSYAQRRKRPPTTGDLTTPMIKTQSPTRNLSGKRKLKVPADLKGPTYLSISTNSTSSMSTIGSGYHDNSKLRSGCCAGLFCCFSRDKLDDSGTSASLTSC